MYTEFKKLRVFRMLEALRTAEAEISVMRTAGSKTFLILRTPESTYRCFIPAVHNKVFLMWYGKDTTKTEQ